MVANSVCIVCNKGSYGYKSMLYQNALNKIRETDVPEKKTNEYEHLCRMSKNFLHEHISCSYGLSGICKYTNDVERSNHLAEQITQRIIALSFESPDETKEAISLISHINPSGAARLRKLLGKA